MNRRAVISGLCLALAAARLTVSGAVPGAADIVARTAGERLVHVVNNPDISGLLLGVGFAGLLVEMQTLRLIAGIVGVGALALFFGTHVVAGSSDSLVLGLGMLGLVGIVLELHVLPGHGVAGVLGLLALAGAVVLAFGAVPLAVAVQSVAIAIVAAVVLYVVAARIFPRNAFVQRLVFRDSQGADYVAAPDYRRLIGRHGFASSLLRPAGVAAIEGQRVDVLTDGDFVPAGSAVVVTRVEGARVFVRAEGSS